MKAITARPIGARGGFTLLEVLLAMALLLFGMSAVLGLLTCGSALARTAQLRTSAAMAVEAVNADLEETLFPFRDGEVGEPVPVVDRELAGVDGLVYSATARANPDEPREYRVDVEMRWRSGGVQREKRFTTLLLRELSFGERLRRRFVEGDATALEADPDARARRATATPGTNTNTNTNTSAPAAGADSTTTAPARADAPDTTPR